MNLPNDSIGISDMNDYLACPRRFGFKMRRHTEEGEPPEARGKAGVKDPTSAYGSAIHHAIFLTEEEAYRDDEAAEAAFREYAAWLEPTDLERLRKDMETYRNRDYPGVKTVVSEGEYKVPLMQWKGKTIYFRFKIDRLFQRLDDPSVFVGVDYKSSKWLLTQQEVHDDRQQWAYNWGIHEMFPECENLLQVYDQLVGGQMPTSKSDAQRAEIKAWLQQVARAILEEEEFKPTWNDFCAWCPIRQDCPELDRLSQFALDEIAVLEKPKLKQDGSPGKRKELKLDPDRFEEYTSKLPKVRAALRYLEKFRDEIQNGLKRMPDDRRTNLGFTTSTPKKVVWTPTAMQQAYDHLGPELFDALSLSKTQVEKKLKDDPEALDFMMSIAEEREGNPIVEELANSENED